MTGIRLRHLAQVNPATPEFESAAADEPVTFVPLEAVWPAGLDVSRTRPSAEVAQGYTRFREGDILIPKITPTFEADRSTIARSLINGFAAGTTELHVVRPGAFIDGRYVNYLVSSRPFLLGGTAEMIGVAGQKRVPDSWLRDLIVPVTEAREQRAIADFLDTETARIDALITKKRRMIDLLEERFCCWRDLRLGCSQSAGLERSGPWPWVPLRRVATVHGGLTLGKTYDHGRSYPYLRVANVQDRALDLAEVLTVDLPSDVADRFVLREGDVLMLEGNGNPDNLGRGTIWRGEIERCLHQNHVHAVRVDPRKLMPEYLDGVVRTAWAKWIFSAASAQVSIATLSQQQILDLVVPLPPTAIQAQLVAEVGAAHARLVALAAALDRQIALLQEHRQALITAAVTGEIEVPGVAA